MKPKPCVFPLPDVEGESPNVDAVNSYPYEEWHNHKRLLKVAQTFEILFWREREKLIAALELERVYLREIDALNSDLAAAQADLASAKEQIALKNGFIKQAFDENLALKKLIDHVAVALCKVTYSARTFDEYVAPSRQLWQRLVPEATVAVDAMLSAAPAAPKGKP